MQDKFVTPLALRFSSPTRTTKRTGSGRCYERFSLKNRTLGIRNAFLNQPVEVTAIRPQFASWLDLGPTARPNLVVRFGRGRTMPLLMRRPVQYVLV